MTPPHTHTHWALMWHLTRRGLSWFPISDYALWFRTSPLMMVPINIWWNSDLFKKQVRYSYDAKLIRVAHNHKQYQFWKQIKILPIWVLSTAYVRSRAQFFHCQRDEELLAPIYVIFSWVARWGGLIENLPKLGEGLLKFIYNLI